VARIYLTGRLAIEGPARIVDELDLPGVQGRVALAALVLTRGPISRDGLAGAIWEADELPAGWEKALGPIVSKLRTALSQAGIDGRETLVSGTGAFELRRQDDIEVDVEQCTTAVDAAEGALRRADIGTAWANASIGTAIARRPFLAGVYSDWVVGKRQELEDLHYRGLEVLVDVWVARDDLKQAVGVAEALTSVDRLRERGHRRLIELHGAANDAASAQRAYLRCREALGELGVEPSEQTIAALVEAGGHV
jgi:DNA-binding SARP family transcriptional activator